MTDPSGLAPELKKIQIDLLRMGVKLRDSELEVYALILDEPRTVQELANKRDVTTQAIYPLTNALLKYNLVRKLGKYWEPALDLRDSVDLVHKFYYQKETLTLAELIWYLRRPIDITSTINVMDFALSQLYHRARKVRDGQKPVGPTPGEIKSLLIHMSQDLLEFQQLIDQVLKAEVLFEKYTEQTHNEFFGDDYSAKTKHYIEVAADTFRNLWGSQINARGFSASAKKEIPIKAVINVTLNDWKDPKEGTE